MVFATRTRIGRPPERGFLLVYQRLCKGLPLQDLEGMDGNKPLANHQCQGCIQDSE
jgi:hypothetical protein